MKSTGRLWVAGLLALGAGLAAFAVWHWSQPENSVRWTFTSFHAALMPNKRRDAARSTAADQVILDGVRLGKEDFFATYVPPYPPGDLRIVPCPASPGHWDALMYERAWCFFPLKHGWKLHRVGKAPCDDR